MEGVAHFAEVVVELGGVAGEAVAGVLAFGARTFHPPSEAAGDEEQGDEDDAGGVEAFPDGGGVGHS